MIHIKRDKSLEIRKLDQVILTNKMAINNPWSNWKPKEEKQREREKRMETTIKYEPLRKGQFERQTENQICTRAHAHSHARTGPHSS